MWLARSEDVFSLASQPPSRPETDLRGDHIDVHLLNGLVVKQVRLKPDLRGFLHRKLAGFLTATSDRHHLGGGDRCPLGQMTRVT